MTEFSVTTRYEDGALVVVPAGELDIATVDAVRTEVARREAAQSLVIDLRGLEFMDTSGIAFVVEAFRDSTDDNGFGLRIIRAAPGVQRVFEIAGLEGVLPFEDGADG